MIVLDSNINTVLCKEIRENSDEVMPMGGEVYEVIREVGVSFSSHWV